LAKPLHQGLTEQNVYIGDIFRWGEALIQVTQPRSPCFKLNFHFAISDMAQLMQNSGKTGWLYRVIAGGRFQRCAAGAGFRLSDVSVHEAGAIAWHMPFDDEQYHRLLSAAGLSVSWSRTMQKRRLSGKIEIFAEIVGEIIPHIKYSGMLPRSAAQRRPRRQVRLYSGSQSVNRRPPSGLSSAFTQPRCC
jgi:hypothetical protein